MVNIKKITKKNGITVYREQIYLGIDCMTGKQVYTTISAPNKKTNYKQKRELQNKTNLKKMDTRAIRV